MIISVRRVKKTRDLQLCEQCYKTIIFDCVSVYGAADKHDRPYRIWIHESCASFDIREKLRKLPKPEIKTDSEEGCAP